MKKQVNKSDFIKIGKTEDVAESAVNGRQATPGKNYVVLLEQCKDYSNIGKVYSPLGVKKPMSYMLNRMVTLGWVERYTTKEDIERGLAKPHVYYKITNKGKRVLNDAKNKQ